MSKKLTTEQFLSNTQKIDIGKSPKALSMVAAFICCVDGDVNEQEIKKAVDLGKKFIGKNFSKPEFEKEIQNMMELVDFDIPEAVVIFQNLMLSIVRQKKDAPVEEKQALIALLCELAFADGHVDAREVDFINSVCDVLHFENPFSIDMSASQITNVKSKYKLEAEEQRKKHAEARWMIAKMLTDAATKSGLIPVERQSECMGIIAAKLTTNHKLGTMLVESEASRNAAFAEIIGDAKSKMGLGKSTSQKYVSTRSKLFLAVAIILMGWFALQNVDLYRLAGMLMAGGFRFADANRTLT